MPHETLWSSLEAGKVDTRRVSASARWNWFWPVTPRADVALVTLHARLEEFGAGTRRFFFLIMLDHSGPVQKDR